MLIKSGLESGVFAVVRKNGPDWSPPEVNVTQHCCYRAQVQPCLAQHHIDSSAQLVRLGLLEVTPHHSGILGVVDGHIPPSQMKAGVESITEGRSSSPRQKKPKKATQQTTQTTVFSGSPDRSNSAFTRRRTCPVMGNLTLEDCGRPSWPD